MISEKPWPESVLISVKIKIQSLAKCVSIKNKICIPEQILKVLINLVGHLNSRVQYDFPLTYCDSKNSQYTMYPVRKSL